MMRLKPGVWLLAMVMALPALAHIGSADIYYDGNAGPYHLNVTIRMPQTVPGIATVEIRSGTPGIQSVRVAPMALLGSTKLSPTPDVAQRSAIDPQFFTANVWLMEPSGFQIHIQADGLRGPGELGVPGTAVPQTVLPMQRGLGILLFALMLFLSAGLVAIIGASVGEAQLEPGEIPSAANRRRMRIGLAVGGAFVLSILIAGDYWWRAEAVNQLARTQPVRLVASLEAGHRLVLNLPNERAETRSSIYLPVADFFAPKLLLPDHDHLMHMFLVRVPAMDQFWHLHPEPGLGARGKQAWFSTDLPSLPAGHYRIFADIVRITGAAPTLVGEIDLPAIHGALANSDDSGGSAAPLSPLEAQRTVSLLPGGLRMIWEAGSSPLKARTYTVFRFHVEDKSGKLVTGLTPYMGMAGHAEFLRDDCSTFAHVHPMGGVSMAAVQLAEASYSATPAGGADHMMMSMPPGSLPPTVTFPYGFPRAGRYRIFVQVKRGDQVLSGSFDAVVSN